MAARKVSQLVGALLIALTMTNWSADVTAQDRPDASELTQPQREELGALLSRAKKSYEAGNFLEAIEALNRAHDIFPEPNILYRIGDAYESLGDLERAVASYRAYLDAAPDARDHRLVARRLQDLERRIESVQKRLEKPEPTRRAALLLDTNPAGATVLIDGEEAADPTPVRVEVEPGTHHLQIEHDGYEGLQRDIAIDQGETISLVYQLRPLPEPAQPKGVGPGPWLVGGVGILSLGSGASFFLLSGAAAGRVASWDEERERAYQNGDPVPERPPNYDASLRNKVLFRNLGWAGVGVGGLAILGAVGWLVIGSRADRTESHLTVSLWGSGARLDARF